ncbi:MAG: hypothetical protein JWO11_2072 [Nocardioides sp.]|nr:hypothetical protein [Nocardioides sp.]
MPDSAVHQTVSVLYAFIENLRRAAEALSADEPPGSFNATYAEAYMSCADDLERILAGSLTAERLLV